MADIVHMPLSSFKAKNKSLITLKKGQVGGRYYEWPHIVGRWVKCTKCNEKCEVFDPVPASVY